MFVFLLMSKFSFASWLLRSLLMLQSSLQTTYSHLTPLADRPPMIYPIEPVIILNENITTNRKYAIFRYCSNDSITYRRNNVLDRHARKMYGWLSEVASRKHLISLKVHCLKTNMLWIGDNTGAAITQTGHDIVCILLKPDKIWRPRKIDNIE